MSPLSVVSWNVNSVRVRLSQVAAVLAETQPDVVCLQETRVADGSFPAKAFAEMGYAHQALYGMKTHNGVAVLARRPFRAVERYAWCGQRDCRHIAVRLAEGPWLHNLYIPAGGDVPDPESNPRFAHKLDFLDALTAWFAGAGTPREPAILVGDLNVAPLPTDVWSHEKMLKVVSHTPPEVARLDSLADAASWVDAVRHVIPPREHLYTWWSYRTRDWKAGNRGRRLDHAWVTPDLAPAIRDAFTRPETRDWERPSDHIPVGLSLDGG